MSKYLIKILAVCAFVVLLPLAIVATALGVTESSACTLNLFISGNNNANASAKVLINSEESTKFTAVKNSQVELTFESEGYYFIGWFNGTKDTFKPESDPVSKDARFTYTIADVNSNLTAVCVEKTYNIRFKGFESFNGTFVYGQNLPQAPAGSESESTFIGWTVENESGFFNTATFNASSADASAVTINVEPVFSDEKIVTYYDVNDNVIETKHYNEEQFANFTLKTAEELSANITHGYRLAGFVSKDDGTVIDEVFIANLINKDFSTAPLNIKLVEEIGTFKMNVKFHASSDEVKELQCRIDVDGVTGADQFTRTGYTFKGIKVGDVIYTKSGNDFVNADETTLSSVIIDGSTEGVAVWEFGNEADNVKATSNSINVIFTANAGRNESDITIGVVGIDESGNKTAIRETSKIIEFSDDADGIKLEDKIFEKLLGYNSYAEYAGKDSVGKTVTLKEVSFEKNGGVENALPLDKDETFLTLAQKASGAWEGSGIRITFIFG